jgi:CO/xanthine dehydrogenase FAD-binding subunit
MLRFEYHRPRSLPEALRLRGADPASRYVAGATDVLVQVRAGALSPSALISLRSVNELCGIEVGPRGARIGAATTIAQIAAHAGLRESYPVLTDAAAVLGSPQIRNAATVGGNLCNASPCADTAPALLVLDARLRLASASGTREIALSELFLGPGATCLAPGELVTDVLLDPPAKGTRAAYCKKGRVHMDLAQASLAVLVVLEGAVCRKARLAAGSVAPVPLRLKEVEAVLEGAKLSDEVLRSAADLAGRSVKPITDVRATADYRRALIGTFLHRTLAALRDGSHP